MYATTLQRRAAALALCAGVATFGLALPWRLVVPAIGCGMLVWAAARSRAVATARAIDAAVTRLAQAGEGDLDAAVPAVIHSEVPQLAHAMEALFVAVARHLDQVAQAALVDPVTGLPNRASFRAAAEPMLARADDGGRAALFFVDLDRFKAVNDTYGHAGGDQLLAQVAERLRHVAATVAPAGTLIGRLAGDEFTMLCPRLGTGEDMATIGDALLDSLQRPYVLSGRPVTVGASIGVALAPEDGGDLTALMRAADAAMYQSKAQGRARLSRYSQRLADDIDDRERLDRDLAGAIVHNEFELVFQPQVRAAGGALVSSEALLRWRHPTQGLRAPAAFLDRAEETGQITAIGDWVVETAAQAIASWERSHQPGALSLNVSLRELEDEGFFARLGAAFDRAGANAERLELELSERTAMCCPPPAIAALAALREAGARIVIDDFGTAASNVQQLRALPIDRIKLDRALVHDVADDPGARAILQALIGLVHGLGCEAVAEGVETPAQVDVLRVLGCDLIQGYVVAHPMGSAALTDWIGRATVPLKASA